MDIEQQLLLQLPPLLSARVNKLLNYKQQKTPVQSLNQQNPEINMSITFMPEKKTQERETVLQIGENKYTGKLVDMPTAIETWKTFDGAAYFKSADIAQMIVVQESEVSQEPQDPAVNTNQNTTAAQHSSNSISKTTNSNQSIDKLQSNNNSSQTNELPPSTQKSRVVPIQYPHGITPQTYNIRPKRFERHPVPPVDIVRSTEDKLAFMEAKIDTMRIEMELVEVFEEEEVPISEQENAFPTSLEGAQSVMEASISSPSLFAGAAMQSASPSPSFTTPPSEQIRSPDSRTQLTSQPAQTPFLPSSGSMQRVLQGYTPQLPTASPVSQFFGSPPSNIAPSPNTNILSDMNLDQMMKDAGMLPLRPTHTSSASLTSTATSSSATARIELDTVRALIAKETASIDSAPNMALKRRYERELKSLKQREAELNAQIE